MRGSTKGPFKSGGGFEIGSDRSGPGATNTTICSSGGNITAPGTLTACGNTTLSGTLTVCGAVVGMRKTVTAVVGGATTLTAAQSGSVLSISSASGAAVVTLPATASGLEYTFLASVGTGTGQAAINISPAKVDSIAGTFCSGASGYVTIAATDDYDIDGASGSINAGDYITLVGDGSAGWFITGGIGVWASAGAT